MIISLSTCNSSPFRLAESRDRCAYILVVPHRRPEKFGVISFTGQGENFSREEKPRKPQSRYIIPGLYFYDASVVQVAENLPLCARGEMEITDENKYDW